VNINRKVFSGLKWSSFNTVTVIVIQLLQVSLLARVLKPEDFGTLAVATICVNFSMIFANLGTSSALIYKQESTAEQLSSLFWLSLCVSGLSCFCVLIVTPFIANHYNQPLLVSIIPMISVTIIINSVGSQFRALLERDLSFKVVNLIDILSLILGFVVCVVAAYILKLGVYSLVLSYLFSSLMKSGLLTVKGWSLHSISFYFSYKSIDDYFSFGLFQTGEKLINFLNKEVDSLLISRFLGLEVLGFYQLSKMLAMKPIQVINPMITSISFPILSKYTSDKSRHNEIFLNSQSFINVLNVPIYLIFILYSEYIITLFFGEGWGESIDIFPWLAIYCLLRSFINPTGSFLLSLGKADAAFYWNVFVVIVMPASIYIGAITSIYGVVFSLIITLVILQPMNWFCLIRPYSDIKIHHYAWASLFPVLVGLISYVPLYKITNTGFINIENNMLNLLFVMVLGTIFYFFLTLMLNSVIKRILFQYIKR